MKKLKTDISFIQPDLIESDEGIRAWFTLKNEHFNLGTNKIRGLNLAFNTAEDKEVIAQNRLALLESLNLNPDWVAYADQVHSNRIQVVTQGGTYPSTDGLITKIPGLTLSIQVADCAAVLAWDSENKIIGALHAGWRGAVGDIVPKGIQMMTQQGANPAKIKAFVSPCLSLKNFEVGQEVAEQFPDQFVDYESYSKPHVDLKDFLRYQMEESGIPTSNIEIREECTVERAEDFYSYRREGDKSGRMMGLIQITGPYDK
jgi:YfiH family protein